MSTITATRLYDEIWDGSDDLEERCRETLNPRGADMLLDLVASSLPHSSRILDVGCGDGRQAISLASRLGCQVLAIDPALTRVEQARRNVLQSSARTVVRVDVAAIEAMPVADSSIDVVWCRDVLIHIDLQWGLAECARVLRPGGRMLIYNTFAAPSFDRRDATRLYSAMAIVGQNMDEAYFRATCQSTGLFIMVRDVVSSEWLEHRAEEAAWQSEICCFVPHVCAGANLHSWRDIRASDMRRLMRAASGASIRCSASCSRPSMCW